MGIPFDFAQERPEHIDQILNGLDRYNPETTAVFQDYVMQQCESQTYDCYANLALLKLYVIPALVSNLPASSAILVASYIFSSGLRVCPCCNDDQIPHVSYYLRASESEPSCPLKRLY